MKITRVELAGTPRNDEQLPRAMATIRKTPGNRIEAEVHSSSGKDYTLSFPTAGSIPNERERWKQAEKAAVLLDGTDADAKTVLQVVETMMAMAAPAPATEATAHDQQDFEDAIRDNLLPETVAAIAHAASGIETLDWDVDRQVDWFAKTLRKMIGSEYDKMIEDLGLKK